MPVMVTGAGDALGGAVVGRLLRTGGEVRAFVDRASAAPDAGQRLRAAGCKVAVGDLDDEGHLEAALAQVHSVVHCWGGPLEDPDAVLPAGATLASALLGAGVRRLIWVRELADDAANPFLTAQRAVGALFDELPIEVVQLATAVRHGPGDRLTRRVAADVLPARAAAAMHAPVHVDDVARAVVAADRERTTVADLRVRAAVIGPETMPLGDAALRLRALEPAAASGGGPLPPWAVDWLALEATGPPPDAAATTVVRGRSRLPVPAAG